ncbi:hypothetical protein RDI61_15850 [Pseudomonas plecoglossicida]|uniref:hypothetical protein n=1 Tax=Pseudomonas putida group TaxID=136845 RepID=UPI0024109B6A|nr:MULTISPECIES: hypothetical protein [Pseudomonas putida group]MDQ7965508.1 hypothetical protein [Pseudomonas plecoglossicida]WFG03777.1 hypothetical protein P3X84_03865 [Pseudomonas putida]
MATIPTGPAVPRVLPDAQQNRVITMDTRGQNQAAQQLAGDVQRAAYGILDQQRQEDQALARVKASNALFERETQISTINSDLAEQVRLGTLSHDKLEEAYTSAVQKLEPLQFSGLSEPEIERMGLAQQRLQLAGQEGVRKLAIGARTDAAKGDLATRLDLIGKEAAMPGVDIGKLNSRLDGEDMDMAGRLAYGEMWPAKKQEAKDANWTTQATQRVVSARDGLGTLQQIEHDLTAADGFYAGKLDPDKRNQLLNTVTGRIYQVKEHAQRQAEMREMKAERVLAQMDRQAATGIPPTPADQQRWRASLAGTSMAGEYNTRITEMNEVQGLLRKPVLEQQQYLDTQRRKLAETGGSVAQISNLNRLQTAVDNNLKMMREDPLTFNAMRTGHDVEPLDFTSIGSPEGQAKLAEQLGRRYDTVNSMRRDYGPQVARNPWKPGEQAMLTSMLAQADDGTKLTIFGTLAKAAPTGADYAAAIKPLVADQPVTVLAGMAKFRDLKGADGTDVPKMLLSGQKILADKSVPMPQENLMRDAFNKKVGMSLAPGSPQREQAYLGFKALYASTSTASGISYKEGADPDSDVVDKAVDMITGGITERASTKVIKPYGMTDVVFNKVVDIELEGLAKRTEFPIGQLEDMPLEPVPGKEGIYYLMNAGRIQVDPKTNEPMIVRVK